MINYRYAEKNLYCDNRVVALLRHKVVLLSMIQGDIYAQYWVPVDGRMDGRMDWWMDLVSVEAIDVQWSNSCSRYQFEVIRALCILLLDVAIRRWSSVVIKGRMWSVIWPTAASLSCLPSICTPLISHINEAFSSTQLPLPGYFLSFKTILCKP